MTPFTLFLYMIAFAIGCMALALMIVYKIQARHKWLNYLIACHASLIGCMMFSSLKLLTDALSHGLAGKILEYVFDVIIISDLAFLMTYIPYFITWVIAQPFRKPYRAMFISLSCVFWVIGMVDTFVPHGTTGIFEILMIIFFVFVLMFCLAVLLKNIFSVATKVVRYLGITLTSITVAMIPLLTAAIFFSSLRALLYGMYFLAYSLTAMIFLFLSITRNIRNQGKPVQREITLESLAEYHITEREFDIIKYISDGLTNKEIASNLGISTNTVNNHVANIFQKTQVRSRIDLLNLIRKEW